MGSLIIQSVIFVIGMSVFSTDCLELESGQTDIHRPYIHRSQDDLPVFGIKDRESIQQLQNHDSEVIEDQFQGETKASMTQRNIERGEVDDGMTSERHDRRRHRRSTDFSSDETAALVDKHNELRGQVSPEASNMEFMSWDGDLATMAQQWSDTCYFGHGQTDNISPFSSLGQNLWLGTATNTPPDGTGATQAWYNEDQYYDYETTECSYVCGHYTQVVWASSYALGCGRSYCESASSESTNYTNVYIITCNYGPAGNYVGAQPYDEGPSCTQCDSGVALCYNNLCNTCSLEEDGCECRVSCENCATITNNCTCECQDGWYGADCSTECVDTHQYCWNSPGWPGPAYCDLHNAVPKGCPYMCGLCNLADPEFVCGASTAQMTTAIIEDDNNGNETNSDLTTPMTGTSNQDDHTKSSTVWTTTASEDQSETMSTTAPGHLTSESTPVTADISGGCDDVTCQNGGTLEESSCICLCADDYQGEECQNVKTEIQYGVEITIQASIDIWQSISDLLLRVVAEIVTDWCNINFSTCCPNQGSKNSEVVLDYVNDTGIAVAVGYPEESATSESSAPSFSVMLLVTPPLSTELCDSGSASRRRRSIRLDLSHIQKRSSEIKVAYLDQEALYTAITESLDIIELELNMTIGEITRGEVETAPSTLSIVVIAGIVVASVVALIIVIVGVIICMHKSTHTTKVHAMSGSMKPAVPS